MKKIVTPVFRVSFPNVFQPRGFEGQKEKYSVVMLFSKEDKEELKALSSLLEEAAREKWPDDAKRKAIMSSKLFKYPLRDGDAEKPDMDGYPGCFFASATAKAERRPGLVDDTLQPIIDSEQFYGGCYARATITAYAFDVAGNKGVAFGLQNIMKVRDGEPFGFRSTPENDFADFANNKEALFG